MFFAAPSEPLVGFVCNHDEIVSLGEIRDDLQIFGSVDDTGGVVRGAEENGAGPIAARRFELGPLPSESIPRAERHPNRFTTAETNRGLVADETGIFDENFIPWVEGCHQ